MASHGTLLNNHILFCGAVYVCSHMCFDGVYIWRHKVLLYLLPQISTDVDLRKFFFSFFLLFILLFIIFHSSTPLSFLTSRLPNCLSFDFLFFFFISLLHTSTLDANLLGGLALICQIVPAVYQILFNSNSLPVFTSPNFLKPRRTENDNCCWNSHV